jgi:hypothetical protein
MQEGEEPNGQRIYIMARMGGIPCSLPMIIDEPLG